MGYFIASIIMILLTSYLITCMLKPEKISIGIIYFSLIAFAENIFTFEALSLVKMISIPSVICFNIFILVAALYFWFRSGKCLWKPNINQQIKRIFNSIKLDKSLGLLLAGFCFLIIVSIILCIAFPVVNDDAWEYHVLRCLFWIKNGTLNHFAVSDLRNISFPINSEILYTWVLLFLKKDIGLGLFALIGYINTICGLCLIMDNIGFCTRKKLWAILILSSFCSIIVQMSSTETDLIVAGLVSAALGLFWFAIKQSKVNYIEIFMASLAYAIAIGTKTTAFFAIPAIGIFMLVLSKKLIKSKTYKPFLLFLGFCFLNFLFFSAYNYVLNLIDFGSLIGPKSISIVNRNFYGIKGMLYNFIKNSFLLINTSGFVWGKYFALSIKHAENYLFSLFNIAYVQDGIYSPSQITNVSMLDPLTGTGVLGMCVFLPCVFWGLIKPLKEYLFEKKKVKRITKILCVFSLLFIANILVMSYMIAFMAYNVRFITFFIALSSPILAFSYFKKSKFLKPLIILFAMTYFTIISTHIWARPLFKLTKELSHGYSLTQIRGSFECDNITAMTQNGNCSLKKYIEKNIAPKNPIIVFSSNETRNFFLYRLILNGYKIDNGLLENLDSININDYKYIIIPQEQISGFISNNEHLHKDVTCFTFKNWKIPKAYGYNNPFKVSCFLNFDFAKQNKLILIKTIKPESLKDILAKFNKKVTETAQEKPENIIIRTTFFIYKNPNFKK